MRYIVLLLLMSIPLYASSQSKAQKQKFADYQTQGLFKVDKPNIIVTRIIEGLEGDKDVLYVKVKSFLSQYYDNVSSIIELDDKETGLVLGKAYMRLASWNWMFQHNIVGTDYTLRIDIKDERVRVTCSASQWVHESVANLSDDEWSTSYKYIMNYAPFTKNGFVNKGVQSEVFFRLVDDMHSLFDELEVSLRENQDDW